jgi:hypothetical protein
MFTPLVRSLPPIKRLCNELKTNAKSADRFLFNLNPKRKRLL